MTDRTDGVPTAEAMKFYGVSQKTIYRWIDAGRIDAYEVHVPQGHEWRVVLGTERPSRRTDRTADRTGGQVSVPSVRPEHRPDIMGDRLRVVVEELQRTRQRVAQLEAERPQYGPRDPGPPVDLPREIIEDGDTIVPVWEPDAAQGFWARLRAIFAGG